MDSMFSRFKETWTIDGQLRWRHTRGHFSKDLEREPPDVCRAPQSEMGPCVFVELDGRCEEGVASEDIRELIAGFLNERLAFI